MEAFGRVAGDDDARLRRVRITLAAATACGLLLSWRLWVSSPRNYPTAPVTDLLPRVPFPLDFAWLLALLALLAAVALSARPRRYAAAFLVLAGLLCMFDQSRWQPWFYMYYFMLAAACFATPARGGEPGGARRGLDACRLVVASMYFWGGLNKVNYTFATIAVRSLTNPYMRYLPEEFRALNHVLAVVIPLAEITVGVGLLTRRFRDAAVLLACATHLFVLALFVPVRDNVVIWPWNVAMAALVLMLFGRDRNFSFREVVTGGRFLPHRLALVLFGVMPLFGLFNLWDSYLSAALYSANTSQASIHVSDALRERLPPEARAAVRSPGGRNVLNVAKWSYVELNVPAYPEPRIYREVAKWVCRSAEAPSDAVLEIQGRPDALDGRRTVETSDCGQLNKDPDAR